MIDRILSVLRRRKQGMGLERLRRELQLAPRKKLPLKKALEKMESQGMVYRIGRKYFIIPPSHLIKGRYISSSKGYGFVAPEEELTEDIFIPPPYSAGALDGDLVEVTYRKKGVKGKPEGRIVRILEKYRKRMVGLHKKRERSSFFLPLENPLSEEVRIVIPPHFSPGSGAIVEAERETMHLTDVLGMPDDPGVDTEAVIRKYDLPSSFSREALEEARLVSPEISDEEIKKRADYRDWTSVTIDGQNAQDFDDAVSVRRFDNGRFLLGIHIADVAHYVTPGSHLERDAAGRGTSVYFSDRTLHMLPEELSTSICSLRPQEDRLTLSVLLEIDQEGNVIDKRFHPSLIKTKARLTYSSVFKIFEGDEEERSKFPQLVSDLLVMRELARLLSKKRKEEGSLDFDLTEPELIYVEGNLVSILPFEANEAHQVIEEFMVIANEAVAAFLSAKKTPLIFRIHPQPGEKDLRKLEEMLAHFGLSLPQAKKLKSRDLQRTLFQAEGKPWEKFINLQVLKSLKLASYSPENRGHYGLAKDTYTHFTSPIRRYPDLVVHRILKSKLRGKAPEPLDLESIANLCSRQERRAEQAEGDLLEWRIYRHLRGKLGEEVEGIIVDITKAGLVVELDRYFVDGMIFFSDLGEDYYVRKTAKTLEGRSLGRRFELGDRVKGTIVSVDPVLRRMSLTLSQNRGKSPK
jgi:ribonuclease R